MTKLLVASGLSNGSYISSVEVIDLSASALPCQYLPNFPLNVAWPMGGLFNNNIPLICGGFDGTVSLNIFHIPLRTFVTILGLGVSTVKSNWDWEHLFKSVVIFLTVQTLLLYGLVLKCWLIPREILTRKNFKQISTFKYFVISIEPELSQRMFLVP